MPGWFDKPLKRRRPRAADLEEIVLIAPSDAFVSTLPGGKVPDRDDFLRLGTAARIRQWESVLDRCRVLVDEWVDLIDGGRFGDALEPFPE